MHEWYQNGEKNYFNTKCSVVVHNVRFIWQNYAEIGRNGQAMNILKYANAVVAILYLDATERVL